MNDKLKNLIKDQLSILPKETQDVLNTFKWMEICEEIGRTHKLLEPEILQFQTETALVLLGLEEMEYFAKNIEKEVDISKEDAEALVKDATEKILKPIAKEITEKIKIKVKDGNQKWDQNINFIVSGGDYSAFITARNPESINSSKDKIDASPNQISNGESMKKMEDLKSKFTI